MNMHKSTHLWREEDHPRDERGKFCKNNHLGNKVVDKSRKNDTIKSVPPTLSKQEWAIWYEKIGEIKRGYAFRCNLNGDYYIPIGNKIVVTRYNYIKPKVLKVVKFFNEDDLVEFLEGVANYDL